ADVVARVVLGAALAHQDGSGGDGLAGEALDPEALGRGVAAVPRAPAALGLRHLGLLFLVLGAAIVVGLRHLGLGDLFVLDQLFRLDLRLDGGVVLGLGLGRRGLNRGRGGLIADGVDLDLGVVLAVSPTA